ncbi:hypothetical protein KA025_02970 [Candidatus Saccharibacteria bacterium]|nr:hypothetical protein [Candidatus Saccharibacteria bacterium]
MKLTLIAPTYKRPDICNRLIKSVPSNINILIVNKKYVDAEIVTGAGYEYFSGMKTKFNTLAKSLHRLNNIKLNNDSSN